MIRTLSYTCEGKSVNGDRTQGAPIYSYDVHFQTDAPIDIEEVVNKIKEMGKRVVGEDKYK